MIASFTMIVDNPSHNKRLDEDLYFYRGQSYFHTGEYNKALNDLDQAITLKHYNVGVAHWYKARSYDALGKTSHAEASYKQAISDSDKNKKVKAQILVTGHDFTQSMVIGRPRQTILCWQRAWIRR